VAPAPAGSLLGAPAEQACSPPRFVTSLDRFDLRCQILGRRHQPLRGPRVPGASKDLGRGQRRHLLMLQPRQDP
jgi:hypothetical protein